jgi:small subunit ribosomal protein S2
MMEDLPAANANEAPASEAPAEAEQTEQFELLAAPRGAPDDLTKLTGVGPQLANKLNEAGIFHYWQLAAMQPGDVAKIDGDLKLNGRVERDGWVNQARTLLEAA